MNNDIAISELSREYPGIEGFYFLSARGELGYVAVDGQAWVKELFPQMEDQEFLARHPRFLEELRQFTHDLKVLKLHYMESFETDIELGYLRTTAEDEFPWHCATLVLNKDVVETLCSDYDALLTRGIKDPSETLADSESLQELRGIHHGFDDLANHQDNFGTYHYFPLLFYWPLSMRAGVRGLKPDVETAPMRVLNLLWRPALSGSADGGGANVYGSSATVIEVLRENLVSRGAIDRNRRVENRFSID